MPRRPWHCYRHFGTPPYTRKEYIKSIPHVPIPKFDLGNTRGQFSRVLRLVVLRSGQISANAIEASRLAAYRFLQKKVGEGNYHLKIMLYPHHIIRENKMMAMAGADRLQDGMRQAFGTPIGRAARVYPGSTVMMVRVNENAIDLAKEALRRASDKLPMPTRILVENAS